MFHGVQVDADRDRNLVVMGLTDMETLHGAATREEEIAFWQTERRRIWNLYYHPQTGLISAIDGQLIDLRSTKALISTIDAIEGLNADLCDMVRNGPSIGNVSDMSIVIPTEFGIDVSGFLEIDANDSLGQAFAKGIAQFGLAGLDLASFLYNRADLPIGFSQFLAESAIRIRYGKSIEQLLRVTRMNLEEQANAQLLEIDLIIMRLEQ